MPNEIIQIGKQLLSRRDKIRKLLSLKLPVNLVQLNEIETFYQKPIELSASHQMSLNTDGKANQPNNPTQEKEIEETVSLWKIAYQNLEEIAKCHQNYLENPDRKKNYASFALDYLLNNQQLYRHMEKHQIFPEDIRAKLSSEQVSLEAGALLDTLCKAISMYNTMTNTLEDIANIESSAVSEIGIQVAFFMDCRFASNEPVQSAKASRLSIEESVAEIMACIKTTAPDDLRVGGEDGVLFSRILDEKIAVLKNGKEYPNKLEAVFVYKGKESAEKKEDLLKNNLFSSKQVDGLKTQFTQMKQDLYSWKNFENSRPSSLAVANVSSGNSNVREDLYRTAFSSLQRELIINGITLREYALNYNRFVSDEDVKSFFSQVLLVKFQGTEQQKETALGYLNQYFHQGGLLHPVASALGTDLGQGITVYNETLETHVLIQSTDVGFILTETCRTGFLLCSDGPEPIVAPDCESIKATATMSVNLTKESGPEIHISNNEIQINNPVLKKKLYPESVWQCIMNFLYSLFSFDWVKIFSSENTQHGVDEERNFLSSNNASFWGASKKSSRTEDLDLVNDHNKESLDKNASNEKV